MKPWLLTANDVIDKEPGEGDMVLYFILNPRSKMHEANVGIIARELCEDQWVISGDVRYKEQVLFVLTLDGYLKQQRLSNPLAY